MLTTALKLLYTAFCQYPRYVLERIAGSSATKSTEDVARFQAYSLLSVLCTLRSDTTTLRMDGGRRDIAWHSRRLKIQVHHLRAICIPGQIGIAY